MLGSRATALSHGVDLKINWPGRLGVAPIMGAPFFAMVGLRDARAESLYIGLALALRHGALRARTARAHALNARPQLSS